MVRTEGDTWDLATSVGATATGVAASRALASKQPIPLITDPYADALVKAVNLDHCNKLADGELDYGDDPLIDVRQMCEQIAVRTRFFDDFFLSAAAGSRQAVILAAGLDTRAYRLPWPRDAVVFEIDQPRVLEFKTKTLADLGVEPTSERTTVAVDLRDDRPMTLRDSGFDRGVPTAWIAEGLLIYLPPDARDRLFDNITALSAPGSRLATEHMDMQGTSAERIEKLSERSRRMGSNLDLAALFSLGKRNTAGEYLTTKGWDVTIRSSREAYALNGFEWPDDELTALEGDSGYLSAILN